MCVLLSRKKKQTATERKTKHNIHTSLNNLAARHCITEFETSNTMICSTVIALAFALLPG